MPQFHERGRPERTFNATHHNIFQPGGVWMMETLDGARVVSLTEFYDLASPVSSTAFYLLRHVYFNDHSHCRKDSLCRTSTSPATLS